jgi:hypothetical protein
MKRLLPLFILTMAAFAPASFAQGRASYSETGDHAQVGVFGNFFRLNNENIDFAGLGARVGINANPYIQVEAESAYDFRQAFTETTPNGTGGFSVFDSGLRVLHFMAGPKFQTNRGPVRLFVTAKGGFLDFMFDNAPATFRTFGNDVSNLRARNINGVFYPGAGAEAFWGPIGLRVDVGDEMYFNNGARNNLRIAFGPTLRF